MIYKCVNPNCPSVVKAKILHFAQVMQIKGLGKAIVSQLVDSGLVRDCADLYYLKRERLLGKNV